MSISTSIDKKSVLLNKILVESVNESIQAICMLKEPYAIEFMEEAALLIANCFTNGNKVIIAGNGGSLCDANHFAEELTGLFRKPRPPLPVISLSEAGHLTCVANDLGFEWVFSRGIQAFGKPGDLFIGLSTSGNSPNIVKAFDTAKELQLQTIAFLGKTGGALKGIADLELLIEGFNSSDKIQEAHMAAMHMIIQLVEHHVFPSYSGFHENS